MKKVFLLLFQLSFFFMSHAATSFQEWKGYVPVCVPAQIPEDEIILELQKNGITDVVFSKSPVFPSDENPIYNHNFSQRISSETFSLLFFDDSGKNNVFYISEKEFKSKKVTDVLKNFDASWSVPENEGGGKAYLLFWIILISMWALFSRNLFFIIASLPFFVAGMFITRLGFFHAAILFLQSVCIFSKYKKGHKPFQMVKKDKSIPLFLIISIPVAVFDSITAFFLYILVAACSVLFILLYFYLKNRNFPPMVPAGLFTVKSRFRMENILFSAGALFLMLLFPLIFQSVPASNPASDVKIPVPVSQGIENTDATTISHEEVVQAYFKKKVFPFRKLKETISDETAYHSSGFDEYGKLSLIPTKTFVYNADFKDDTISKITSSTTPSIAKLVFLQDDIFAIKFKNSSKKIKNFVLTTRHFLIFVVSLCVLFWGIFSDHDFNKKACKKIGHSLR